MHNFKNNLKKTDKLAISYPFFCEFLSKQNAFKAPVAAGIEKV